MQAASVAVEALANLMAGSSPNREAVRLAGGVPVLVSLLDSGPWKDITERTTAAIAELVHTCPENQTLVCQQALRQSMHVTLSSVTHMSNWCDYFEDRMDTY